MSVLVGMARPLVGALLYAAPVGMVAATLLHRSCWGLRLGACVGLLTLVLASPALSTVPESASGVLTLAAGYFVVVVGLCLCGVWLCNQTDLWTAAFCAVVGYAVQNLGSGLGDLVGMLLRRADVGLGAPELNLERATVCTCALLAVLRATLVRQVRQRGLRVEAGAREFAPAFVALLVNTAFDLSVRYVGTLNDPSLALLQRVVQVGFSLYVLIAEYEMLYNQHLRTETASLQRLMAERERQYALSRQTIDAINIKCHDIRHQIRHLADGSGPRVDQAVLDDIAGEVSVYDSAVRTGNEALDTILTEKSLICAREGVALSCIADGTALGRMAASDIYALFGNAMDNAIEAVQQLDDPRRRTISLQVRRQAGMVLVHVENCCEGHVAFADGLPQTSKADKTAHGFGVRSMREICERYGGTVRFGCEGGVFHVNMLIPTALEPAEEALK